LSNSKKFFQITPIHVTHTRIIIRTKTHVT